MERVTARLRVRVRIDVEFVAGDDARVVFDRGYVGTVESDAAAHNDFIPQLHGAYEIACGGAAQILKEAICEGFDIG